MTDLIVVVLSAAAAGIVVKVSTGPENTRAVVLCRLSHTAAGGHRRPMLTRAADNVAACRLGALLKGYAERTHPHLIFSDVVALCLLSVLAGAMAGAVFLPAGPLTVLSTVAGPLVADRILLRIHGRRSARISQQLPEALAIQASALRAGNSLLQSLRAVSERMKAPLADEASRTVREMDLGIAQQAALENLASRIGGRDGQLWVNAMLIHRVTGGNLTSVADSLGKRLRERLDLSREVKALTAQARMSGVVVAAAPLVFLVVLSASSPQMKVLYETPAGWGLLIAGLLLELVGFVWIRAVLKVRP